MPLKHPHYKGNKFERDMAKRLSKDFPVEMIRTPMSGAFGTQVKLSDFQGDLYCKTKNSALKSFFFECKHVENATFTNLQAWYTKSESQNGGKESTIFMRDNIHNYILVAVNIEKFYAWLQLGLYQTKISCKYIDKEKVNFWKEYDKISFNKKIPMLKIKNIGIIEYNHWVYIIKRSL